MVYLMLFWFTYEYGADSMLWTRAIFQRLKVLVNLWQKKQDGLLSLDSLI